MAIKSNPIPLSSFRVLFFTWITPFLWNYLKGVQSLSKEHLPEFVFSDNGSSERFAEIWSKERSSKETKEASLRKTWFRFVRIRLLLAAFVYILCLCFGYLSGLFCLRRLMHTLGRSKSSSDIKIFWAFSLIIAEILRLTCFSILQAITSSVEKGTGLGLYYVLYAKLLGTGQSSETLKGKVFNLFSNDVYKVMKLNVSLPLLAGTPLIMAITAVYNWIVIGTYSIIGIFILTLLMILQTVIAKMKSRLRRALVATTDARISITTETLRIIKEIKLHGWESKFIQDIKDAREKEHRQLKLYHYIQCFGSVTSFTAPIMMTFVTIIWFTMAEHPLDAIQIFSLIMINYVAAHAIQMLPVFTRDAIQAQIALKRIQAVLVEQVFEHTRSEMSNEKLAVQFLDVVMTCDKSIKDSKPIQKDKSEIQLSHKFPVGDHTYIIGTVGCGKTSLLKAILGQMNVVSGKIYVNGSTAFVSQEPWLMSGTIRDNIVFGSPFVRQRYLDVLRSCALSHEISKFPNGDLTVIGDNGTKLSGGQKQRITLARAVYADKDIYLLDDPLSAVDESTANYLLERCIKQALKNKTVLFVTSQLDHIDPNSSILLMENKCVRVFGSNELLVLKTSLKLHCLVPSFERKANSNDTPQDSNDCQHFLDNVDHETSGSQKENSELLPIKELHADHQSSHKTYLAYCNYFGSCTCIIVIVLLVFGAVNASFVKWWLGYSVSDESKAWNTNLIWNLRWTELVYAVIITSLILSTVGSWLMFAHFALRASTRLHHVLLKSTLRKPMKYFERTPSGQIINLFTHDMDEIDNHAPLFIQGFLQKLFLLACNITIIVTIYPWFIAPLFFIILAFTLLYKMFRKATKDLKRFENSCRSPVYTHIKDTLCGLIVIKAYNKERVFIEQFKMLSQTQFGSHYVHVCALKWFSTRTDFLCVLITTFAVFFAISTNSGGIPFASLAIVLSMQVCRDFQTVIRMGCNAEGSMVSVERLIGTQLEKEVHLTSIILDKNWFPKGKICFWNVSLRYDDVSPLALKDLNICINPKEKIAIVGRTGAGKSSIVALLFGLIKPEAGKITVDDEDISSIPSETLCRKMTILPQHPVLFTGTVRSNLDPFSEHSDSEIYEALEKAEIKTTVMNLPGQLNFLIKEDEINFSSGEKQLLCLARAILRKNKIIVLDEPTSFVDNHTDAIITKTIRNVLHDSTVITITHKLHNTMGYDKIIVIESGEIVTEKTG